jgi:hypothetical protein
VAAPAACRLGRPRLNNHETADLRQADLDQAVSLDGIRWTQATRWPSEEWKAHIDRISEDVGDGVREIREGISTQCPT